MQDDRYAGEGRVPGRRQPDNGPAARASRKERERERHRMEVLAAAETLLTRKSYSEISVQEIAETAEFSVGYLYKIFSSKEEIFESLLRALSMEICEVVDAHMSIPGNAVEKLRSFIYGTFDWMNDHPAYTCSSVREMIMISPILPGMVAHIGLVEARSRTAMARLFEEGIREGLFRDADPQIMARTIKILMKGFVMEDLVIEQEMRDWTVYAPIILDIFMRAFGPEGGSSKI